jgi:hypothetical protein
MNHSYKNARNVFVAAVTAMAVIFTVSTVQAGHKGCGPSCSTPSNCYCDSCATPPCMNCKKVCITTAEVGEEEKHCWKVECKDKCIPAIRFPWESGSGGLTLFSWCEKKDDCCCNKPVCECLKPKCGKVICVKDIEKEKYKVPVCEYKSEIKTVCSPSNPCGGCKSCCTTPACAPACVAPSCGGSCGGGCSDCAAANTQSNPTGSSHYIGDTPRTALPSPIIVGPRR